MKFALVSNVLPPSETAHAAVIERLLRDRDPATYCLLSSHDYRSAAQPEWSQRLGGRYYHLPTPFRSIQACRSPARAARERLKGLLTLTARIKSIAGIVKRERCDAIVVCTGGNELFDFPAGFVASRVTGTRFYAYLLDQYSHMVSYLMGRSLLRLCEPLVLKGASAVIAPNEFLAEEVERRFGIRPVVIHNACDLDVYRAAHVERCRGDRRPSDNVSIVYTGAIGKLHLDAFRNLIAALGIVDRHVTLDVFSARRIESADADAVRRHVIHHAHRPLSEMPAVQTGADVLFLPLTFDPQFREIVRTAAPGKMGEFLAARRPILVHAPPDSYLASYFRRHECGLVVDRDSPEALARQLERLLSDDALRRRVAANAWRRALEDFDLSRARATFDALVGSGRRPPASR